MVVKQRGGLVGGGRKATTGGGGVNRIGTRGKQTAASGGGVKQTGGPSGGVKKTGGPRVGVKQTGGVGKRTGGGGKRTGGGEVTLGGASTSKTPPRHNSREEVLARECSGTPSHRDRSTGGGGSSQCSNPRGRTPPSANGSPDSQATVSVSRTKSVPPPYRDTTNRLPFCGLSSQPLPSIQLPSLSFQQRQEAYPEDEVDNSDEENDEEEEDEPNGEEEDGEDMERYQEPQGLDGQQLLEHVLALPGRERLTLLSEVYQKDSLWFTRDSGVLTRAICRIFRSNFDDPYYSWSVTPRDQQELYFQTFAVIFHS
ncbi:hypothetical protein AALP_AAs70231U000200 [Arabis alpina]|uniref:Uncharacterized protein n=1 Tax=Arabis alpina TaxID=50452 RepID=A0A087G0X4_ARAAL|nr:hypothetical protein AALP_AAs70231U000200 [Arabis alpina]